MQDHEHSDYHGRNAPAEWIRRFAPLVPAGSAVLDLACGSGRHTAFFLDRGHPVTAIDRDISPLSRLHAHERLELIEADLERDGGRWPLAGRRFGCMVVVNYLWRPILGDIVGAVQEGGVLLYQTFAAGNERFGKPRNPDFLLAPGELLEAVRGRLGVVAYRHGIVDRSRPAVIQSLCAIRGSGPVNIPGPV